MEHGLDPSGDFKEIVFSETYLSILKGVSYGKLDAGFVTSTILMEEKNKPYMKDTRIILRSEPLPQWSLVVRRDYRQEPISAIKSGLLTLKDTAAGREMLTRAGFSAFIHAEPDDFIVIKSYLKFLEEHHAAPE